MYLTPKQAEVLRVIAAANDDGSLTDLDQVIERVSYKPTKDAIQFTIRALAQHGLVEKSGSAVRRDRRRVLLSATSLGKHFAAAYSPQLSAVLIENEDDLGNLGVSTISGSI